MLISRIEPDDTLTTRNALSTGNAPTTDETLTKNETLTIKVINPIYEEIDIGAIYNQGYTTKQGHSGIGLTNVKKILLLYENIESMTYVELGKFIQLLIIRDKG